MSLTPEQAHAVEVEGSVAITASAGSGKTTTLVDRYIFHLKHGIDPLSIVAVTFTERAAHELRSRIRARITEQEDLSRFAPLIDAAPIGTIHSFCRTLCLEFSRQAGVPVAFEVLREDAAPLYRERALLHALERESSDLVDLFGFTTLLEMARTALANPGSTMEAFAKGRDLLREAIQQDQRKLAEDPCWAAFAEQLGTTAGHASDLMEIQRQQALRGLAQISSLDMSGFATLASLKVSGGKAGSWPQGGLFEIKELVREIRDKVKGLPSYLVLGWTATDSRQDETVEILRGFLERIIKRYRVQKRADGYLDFADLEIHARQALLDHQVLAELSERYAAFLIDEFQDTNHLQMAILSPLAHSGLLTVVGDPNQSIYRFRGAEPEIFAKVTDEIISQGGEHVALTETFRSNVGITAVINDTFSSLFGITHDLKSSLAAPYDPSVTLVVPGSSEKVLNQGDARNASAADVAARISELLEHKTLIRDGNSADLRPVTPGDIAVLCTRWAPLDTFAQACWDRDVPAVVVGGGRLLDTQEASDGVNLLRFLADPCDDTALLGLLRSPYVGFSDPELLEIARKRPTGTSWWDALTAHPERSDTITLLAELCRYGATYGPARGFVQATEALCVKEILAELPDAKRRLADFDGIANVVARMAASGMCTAEIVAYLEDVGSSSVKLARPRAGSEAAVSLMTVHAAKGLEWPVVFVVDISPARQNTSGHFLAHHDLGYALKQGEEPSGAYQYLQHLDKLADEQEQLRRWYVALTRARDILVVSCTKERDSAALLVDAMTAAGVTPHEWNPTPPPVLAKSPLENPRVDATPLLGDLRAPKPLSVWEFAKLEDRSVGAVVDQNWETELMLAVCRALIRGQDFSNLAFPALLVERALGDALARVSDLRNSPLFADGEPAPEARWRGDSLEIVAAADLAGPGWVAYLVDGKTNLAWASAVARCYGVERVYAVSVVDGSVSSYSDDLVRAFLNAQAETRSAKDGLGPLKPYRLD